MFTSVRILTSRSRHESRVTTQTLWFHTSKKLENRGLMWMNPTPESLRTQRAAPRTREKKTWRRRPRGPLLLTSNHFSPLSLLILHFFMLSHHYVPSLVTVLECHLFLFGFLENPEKRNGEETDFVWVLDFPNICLMLQLFNNLAPFHFFCFTVGFSDCWSLPIYPLLLILGNWRSWKLFTTL